MPKSKDFKILTLYSYFDYSVFTKGKDGVEESLINDSTLKIGALKDIYENEASKEFDAIIEEVKKKSLADVVLVTIYQIILDKKGYEEMLKMFENLSEQDFNLQIFKHYLLEPDAIIVRGSYPIVLRDPNVTMVNN